MLDTGDQSTYSMYRLNLMIGYLMISTVGSKKIKVQKKEKGNIDR